MRPLFTCMKNVAVALAVVAMSAVASADPVENATQTLIRTQASGLTVQGTLSKNIYRQEAYQAEYPVQVPYQEQEAYTDYETYYDQEYRCETRYENQCGYEQECHQVGGGQTCRPEQVCNNVGGGQQCTTERVCTPRPGGGQQCRQVEECGTNAQGQRICKTRQVCTGGGGGGQDCRDIPRCTNNPPRRECHTENRCSWDPPRQQCSNEYRCRNVPRQVCGYQQVAKTRPVTRYRTVTKYRTEMRCCTTQYRNVFDHQESLEVVLEFSPGSELFAGEVENFRVALIQNAGAALDVDVQVVSTLNNYRIINKVIQGGRAIVSLEQIPVVINPSEVGENSVSNLRLKIMEDGTGVVVFTDVGQKGRLVTVYDLIVKTGTGQIAAVQQASYVGGADQRITLTNRLSLSQDHILELRVSRSGQGLPAPVTFVKTFFRPH